MTEAGDVLPQAQEIKLDKALFDESIPVAAVQVPKRRCHEYMKRLSQHLLNQPRLRNVADDPSDPDCKLLLLSPEISAKDLPEGVQSVVRSDGLLLQESQVAVGYDYWPAATVLKKILPAGMEVPSAFETVGHIAHLNLREEALPYKRLIGQVLLDKNPRLRTVVNKLGSIENEFRVFDMEVLAGDAGTETEVSQHGFRFKLDYRKVYWNSRLEREHSRLVGLFSPDDVILDAMAGIGPFVVPAAAKGCTVYANDLNPDSFKYLNVNMKLNKATQHVQTFNMDGGEFIRQAAAGRLRTGSPPSPTCKALFQHVVMNLPASALEICSAFVDAFPPERWTPESLPTVHVYGFAKGTDGGPELIARLEKALGCPLDAAPVIHKVRDVAPGKHMFCVSFVPPVQAAMQAGSGDGSGGAAKRPRLEDQP